MVAAHTSEHAGVAMAMAIANGLFRRVTVGKSIYGLTHVPVLLRPPDFLTPSVSCLNGAPPHRLSRFVMMRPRKAVAPYLGSVSSEEDFICGEQRHALNQHIMSRGPGLLELRDTHMQLSACTP